MDNFYLYIFILICFIFAVSYLNTYLHDTYNGKKDNVEINEKPVETNEKPVETK